MFARGQQSRRAPADFQSYNWRFPLSPPNVVNVDELTLAEKINSPQVSQPLPLPLRGLPLPVPDIVEEFLNGRPR